MYTSVVIKAVIFDCFGVLTQDGWLSFCQKYLNKENEEELRYVNHQADRGLVNYEQFLNRVCELTGVPREAAHLEITATHSPNEQIFKLVKTLKSNGYKLGVISNVGDELNNFLPQDYVNLFDQITLSYHVGAIKPEPNIYRYHLKQLNLKPEQTIFIDDREPNASGANDVGMHGIFYQGYDQLLKALERLGVNTK